METILTARPHVALYWDGYIPPAYLTLCVTSWLRWFDIGDITVLNQTNARYLVGDLIPTKYLKMYSYALQSDAVSAAFLTKFGGTFIDADTIMCADRCLSFFQISGIDSGDDANNPTDNIGHEKDVLRAFGFPPNRGIHIGALTSAPGGRVVTEWTRQLRDRLPRWSEEYTWNFLGNAILDPYIRQPELLPHLDIIDAAATLSTPEIQLASLPPATSNTAGEKKPPAQSRYEKYLQFWFHGSATSTDKENAADAANEADFTVIEQKSSGIISLHNSWTPPEYRDKSKDAILADSNTPLSTFLRRHALPEHFAEVEELLTYGS